MKLILMTAVMLSLGLLTACGSSGGGDPKADPVPAVLNDLDALDSVITADANENQLIALTIPEYKNTNTYAFTGVDSNNVELSSEDGQVAFKVEADFETQPSYSFIMTVTNASEQTKDIDVTINIIDVPEDHNSLPLVITADANENQLIALIIPEYKDTNSYAFTGIDGDSVDLSSENGRVVFKIEADFETKPTYNFIMTVTNVEEQTKDIDVTINIIDILEDLNSLPTAITESVNENHRFAFAIPEYKDTNSYAFTGVNGDDVKLWPERGEVIFNYAPDFETQPSYNFIMTVTNAIGQTKNVDVTIDIIDVTDAFIFEIEEGSMGALYLRLNANEQDDFHQFSFTIKKDEEQVVLVEHSGDIDDEFVQIKADNVDTDVVLKHTYTITPSTEGDMPAFAFFNDFGSVKINVIQWGDNSWESLHGMFSGVCDNNNFNSNLVSFSDPKSSPNLTRVTTIENAFIFCNFIENQSYWDVSNVINMKASLAGSKGNADLSQWNVSSVENMDSMFVSTDDFNSDISLWDVSNVETMASMFYLASSFNSDISQWRVSSVKNMSLMFAQAQAFAGDISSWVVSSVEDFSYMFAFSNSFSADISDWNVSSSTNMDGMFGKNVLFDQDLRKWNDKVTNVVSCTKFNFEATLRDEYVPNFQNCTPIPAP